MSDEVSILLLLMGSHYETALDHLQRTAAIKPCALDVSAIVKQAEQRSNEPSVGTVGDAYDNALAESHIGLFKTDLIRRRGPWKGLDDVELATLEWVDWHNHRRLHTACDDLTPAELEQVY
jgi:transposase InsO family protein